MYCLAKYITHPKPKNYQRYGLWAESYSDSPLGHFAHALILFFPTRAYGQRGKRMKFSRSGERGYMLYLRVLLLLLLQNSSPWFT